MQEDGESREGWDAGEVGTAEEAGTAGKSGQLARRRSAKVGAELEIGCEARWRMR